MLFSDDFSYKKLIFSSIILFTLIFAFSCEQISKETAGLPFPPSENPWTEIRAERLERLLPLAMQRADVDVWIVICRENDNDPLAKHIGCENAGGTAAFMFFLDGENVTSLVYSPEGEAKSLSDMGVHDKVISFKRGENVFELVADKLIEVDPQKIAINSSEKNIADGLSYTQRMQLEEAIGSSMSKRLLSSQNLVTEWLSVKTPAEIEIMRRAAALTAQLELEAYEMVIPGVTKDSDIAKYLKKRMRELGVEDAWAPEQNPNVNSGVDRGHSHATDKIIQAGDFIQTDFGIKVYGIWVTDIQRFAYVLEPGMTEAPADAIEKWEIARKGSRIALAAMKPGVTGYSVDLAQRNWMKENSSLPLIWGTGHPVGYWAHDAGPRLGGAASGKPPFGDALRILYPGQTFAFDGFFSWSLGNNTNDSKTISVEEMAVITETGAEYLIPPQEELILIKL
ncbi:MAG: aminopeptidase P family protein [Candidatus Marinimicrobia bacterium]|nr:aminopeptidase P family protein [Candidatus Neomarinimicrobiota bacterium]